MAKNEPGRNPRSTETHTRLIRNLVQLNGGAPDRFLAAFTHDGQICIRCDSTVAFYPVEAWVSRFMRHLQRGYFAPCSGLLAKGPLGAANPSHSVEGP